MLGRRSGPQIRQRRKTVRCPSMGANALGFFAQEDKVTISVKTLMMGLAVAMVGTVGAGPFRAKAAHAEPPCRYMILSIDSDGHVEGADVCEASPGPAATPDSGPRINPCVLAQNAMRLTPPPDQRQAATPVGVAPNIVGTWELPLAGGPWVLEVFGNGTYRFHSEAQDGVASNAGTFSASNGYWYG